MSVIIIYLCAYLLKFEYHKHKCAQIQRQLNNKTISRAVLLYTVSSYCFLSNLQHPSERINLQHFLYISQ